MGVVGGERLHSDPLTARDIERAHYSRLVEYAAADEPSLKQWRGLPARTDELATTYQPALHLASILISAPAAVPVALTPSPARGR